MFEPSVEPPPLSELAFQYQPVASLVPHQSTWLEALIRWNLPDGTVRGPLDVLPHWLADNRQDVFTRFSIERVAAVLARYESAHVSINLSPRQLVSPVTNGVLEGLLPHVASRLRIELTEQRFGDTRRLWSGISVVRRLCGAVMLDDVTETDLRDRIPEGDLVDGVKVDRSVTLDIVNGHRRSRAESFITELSRRFPVVVVEGVEDASLCEHVAALGATHVQGFGIGRPSAEPVFTLGEPSLPAVEATAAKASRLNLGSLLLGGGDSELNA